MELRALSKGLPNVSTALSGLTASQLLVSTEKSPANQEPCSKIIAVGEEAKTPQKSIPIGVVMSLLIVFLAYFGMSTVLTMMLPYYQQDTTAPLPHVYDQIGWTAVKYVVSIGACCGLFSR